MRLIYRAMTRRAPAFVVDVIPVVVVAAVSVIFILRSAFLADGRLLFSLFDDGMISMRYAANLVAGDGLVWNPGEAPVEGYSNFLWVLLMATLHLVPVGERLTPLLVSIAGAIVLTLNVYFTVRLARRYSTKPMSLFAAGMLTALCYPLLYWTLRGMEVGLAALFLVFCVEQGIRVATGEARSPVTLLIGLAAMTLLRSDGLVPAVVIGVCTALAMPRNRVGHLLGFVAVPLVVFGAHMLGRYSYYGEWMPNTYYLKMTGVPLLARLTRGASTMMHAAVWFVAVPFALALLNVRAYRSTAYAMPILLAAALCAYSVYVGGDAWEWMPYTNRYVTAALPLVFAAVPFDSPNGGHARAGAFRVACIAGAFLIIRAIWADQSQSPVEMGFRIIAVAGLVAVAVGSQRLTVPVLAFAIFTTVSLPGFTEWTASRGIYTRSDAEAALLGIRLRDATPPHARIAVVTAGSTPYFAHRPAIDLLGKNDPVIARRAPVHPLHPGHDRFDYRYSLGELKPHIVVQLWYTTDEDWDFFKAAGYERLQGMLVRTDLDAATIQRLAAAIEHVGVVPLF